MASSTTCVSFGPSMATLSLVSAVHAMDLYGEEVGGVKNGE